MCGFDQCASQPERRIVLIGLDRTESRSGQFGLNSVLDEILWVLFIEGRCYDVIDDGVIVVLENGFEQSGVE